MSKIGTAFRNFRDRIRAAVSIKTRNVLFFIALGLIVFIAIMIRLTPILRGPYLIKAFDPWIQYYNAKYLSEHTLYEYFHWHDYKSWYPDGMTRSNLRPGLTFTVVVIYKILTFVGINVTLYEVCFFFPAFMGGMTVLAAYFLGKEILNRQCGLLAAFFLAFNTGHMQRTMAGFFDNETIGVFAVLMTFLFFLKAIRTGRLIHSVIGGVFLGYLSLSWGGYTYVFYLLPLVCGLLVLMNKYDEKVLIAYAGVQGTGLLIFSLFVKFRYKDLFSDLNIGGIFLFTIVLIIFHLIYTKRYDYPKFYNGLLGVIKWGMIPAILIVAIIIWTNPDIIPLGLGKRLESILSPLMRDELHIVASVAEHMPSAWSIFYYNTLIPLLLLPLGVFFCFKRGNAADVLLLCFLLTLFYFTGSMIRIILLFAPAAALLGAYGLASVLRIYGSFAGERPATSVSRKRRRQLTRTVGNSEVAAVYFLVGFLCVAQVIHATNISMTQLSYSQIVAGGQFHDWEETLTWMEENLPGDAVVVSWWDYGYWLTPIGNVTTVNDNGTWNSTRIGMTGMAFMQTNEIYSAKVLHRLKADYVLVYFGFLINGLGGDEGKWPWMLRICNDHYQKYKRMGMEEDNWAEDSVFKESEYINSSSQKYENNWFDCQLVRLMFHDEPLDPTVVPDPNEEYLRWYFASQIGGNSATGTEPRKDDNGNTWKSHIPESKTKQGYSDYGFKVFKEAYFSKNRMVKLYQVDYTALESSFWIKNAKVYDNDYSTFTLKNTGKRDLTIKSVKINNFDYNFTMSKGIENNVLKKGESDLVWVDLNKGNIDYKKDDVVNITVSAEADA
ncbi:MAG: STT3 domain-containing protein, partial [Promethearchaeota archaeon]